eukprot:3424566-Pyramimonas_sp.AAC.1
MGQTVAGERGGPAATRRLPNAQCPSVVCPEVFEAAPTRPGTAPSPPKVEQRLAAGRGRSPHGQAGRRCPQWDKGENKRY